MAKRKPIKSRTKRYRVHFRELGYYQSVVDTTTPQQAIREVQESPPTPTFISSEDREVFGVDELRKNKTWKCLDHAIDAEVSTVREARSDAQSITDSGYPLYTVSTAEAQYVAEQTLGRQLTAEELGILQHRIDFDWCETLELLIDHYIR